MGVESIYRGRVSTPARRPARAVPSWVRRKAAEVAIRHHHAPRPPARTSAATTAAISMAVGRLHVRGQRGAAGHQIGSTNWSAENSSSAPTAIARPSERRRRPRPGRLAPGPRRNRLLEDGAADWVLDLRLEQSPEAPARIAQRATAASVPATAVGWWAKSSINDHAAVVADHLLPAGDAGETAPDHRRTIVGMRQADVHAPARTRPVALSAFMAARARLQASRAPSSRPAYVPCGTPGPRRRRSRNPARLQVGIRRRRRTSVRLRLVRGSAADLDGVRKVAARRPSGPPGGSSATKRRKAAFTASRSA